MKKKGLFLKLTELSKFSLLGIAMFLSFSVNAQDIANGLKLHYTFESANGATVSDVSGNGYDGTLYGATVGVSNGKNSLILSTSGTDYLDMGANTGNLVASLTDFSMSCYVWVNSSYANLGDNGNMIATFSNSLDSYNQQVGYMFLQAKRSRYSITTARYEAEQAVQTGSDVEKGKWVHFAYTQSGSTGKLYINGVLVSTNTNVTLTPSNLGATAYNMLAKPSYNGDKFLSNSQISDFRIYDRAVTSDEVLVLNGIPAELISAYNALTLSGDLSNVVGNLTLPTTSGSANIPVVWSSTLPEVVSTTGVVVQPDQYDVPVILTATLTQEVNGVVYTLTKKFNIIVKARTAADDLIARWNFKSDKISVVDGDVKVTDATNSAFVATLKNEASIRTIGDATSGKFNVLDLGNGTGYLDMGTEIGKAVYSLSDYTMSAYFRIDDDYSELGNNGNFFWNFSNSDNVGTDKNGYIFGSLKEKSHHVSSKDWQSGDASLGVWATAPKNGWHHMAYTQTGTNGVLYIDGVSVVSGTMTNLPSNTLLQPGRTGTLYNWLGRSCYASDSYLRKTLIYDFQLLKIGLGAEELSLGYGPDEDPILGVPDMITRLDAAYAANPRNTLPELETEMNSLNPDWSALNSNITLPTVGLIDPTVSISWKTSNAKFITSTGVVTQQNYFSYSLTLTATFSKNGQKVSKDFPATVLAKPETVYNGDLLMKHDFASSLNDSVVVDASDLHLKATLKGQAKIQSIGLTNKYNVLALDSVGCLDLGPEIGQFIYHLNDYTMSAYYRIDEANGEIAKKTNGSFLWTFTNTMNPGSIATGYIFAGLNMLSMDVSPKNWDSATGCQSIAYGSPALTGGWHHFAYTQSGTNGTIYIDGQAQTPQTITNLPSSTLVQPTNVGTLYNYIGRSCYPGDIDLRKSLVYDFRIYKKALTADEIANSVYNVSTTMQALDNAYNEKHTGLTSISNSPYKVIALPGIIRIVGLKGAEKVSAFDITGRPLQLSNTTDYVVNAGVYIVKINNYMAKVVVK